MSCLLLQLWCLVRTMKRLVARLWALNLWALLTTGCAIHPTPPLVGTPTINMPNVQRRLFATVEQLGQTDISTITPLATGYQIGARDSVQTLSSDGQIVNVARFDMTEKFVYPLVRSRGLASPPVFAGSAGNRGTLLIFDESGKRLGEASPNYPTDVLAADIEGDERPEVIVSGDGKSLRIHRTDGSLLRRIELGEYVTSLGAFDTDGDGKDEVIVYTYPSGRGIGRFRVLNGDEFAADWKLDAVCRFSVIDLEDRKALFMLEDTAFVIRDIEGKTLLRFEDPSLSMGGFCRPMGVRLPDGRWFFLATEGHGFPYYLVAMFSGKELVYSEIRKGHARAVLLIRDLNGPAVLVGAGSEIWKYSIP